MRFKAYCKLFNIYKYHCADFEAYMTNVGGNLNPIKLFRKDNKDTKQNVQFLIWDPKYLCHVLLRAENAIKVCSLFFFLF